MTSEVLLTLTGHSTDPSSGETTVTEQSVKAQYSLQGGQHFFLYEEQIEGTDSPTRSLIRLKAQHMELSRKGPVNTRMVFETGKEHMTDYATPFGNLWIGLYTHSLDLVVSSGELMATVCYDLVSDGQPLAECSMTLKALSRSIPFSPDPQMTRI